MAEDAVTFDHVRTWVSDEFLDEAPTRDDAFPTPVDRVVTNLTPYSVTSHLHLAP